MPLSQTSGQRRGNPSISRNTSKKTSLEDRGCTYLLGSHSDPLVKRRRDWTSKETQPMGHCPKSAPVTDWEAVEYPARSMSSFPPTKADPVRAVEFLVPVVFHPSPRDSQFRFPASKVKTHSQRENDGFGSGGHEPSCRSKPCYRFGILPSSRQTSRENHRQQK